MTDKTNTMNTRKPPLSISEIIQSARGSRTQREFAAILGIRQDLLCKYEKGRVNPPAKIIERCMRDVHIPEEHGIPSAEALARRIRRELSTQNLVQVRAAITHLLDALSVPRI